MTIKWHIVFRWISIGMDSNVYIPIGYIKSRKGLFVIDKIQGSKVRTLSDSKLKVKELINERIYLKNKLDT